MANRPTVGGSDGTWGTELNAHLDVSLDTDGKVDDGAAQTTSAAPGADAELANKKYVDDEITTLTTYVDDELVTHAAITTHAKAFASVQSNGTLNSGSLNVSGVVRDSTGKYTVSWDTDFSDTTYAVVVTPERTDTFIIGASIINSKATGNCVAWFRDINGSTFRDKAFSIIAFGAQ